MRKIFTIILLLSYTSLFSQKIIEGKVLDKNSQKPIEGVTIINLKNNKWAITDEFGDFKISVQDDYEISFSMLGKKDTIIFGIYEKGKKMEIFLKDKTLKLDEVSVTSVKKNNSVDSSIIIDKYGISQFQSFSLGEILQQLPGKIITSTVLNKPQILSLRTANTNSKDIKNNAFGVSYILDGTRLSNDENMERYGNRHLFLFEYSNLNTGFDLRNIPSSNIEKIEIIAGIPDAKYGNVTSGVIKIDRQAGYSPLRFSSSINRGSTSISLDKGFKIGNLNRMSVSLDYLNSNSDPRNNLENYNRLTSSVIWSTYNKSETIKNTFTFTYQTNLDGLKVDEEHPAHLQRAVSKKNYSIRTNNRFYIKLNRIIDELNANVGLSYGKSHIYMQSFDNNGGNIAPVALESSLQPGIYTPAAFLSIREVFGEPINFSINLSAQRNFTLHNFSNNISFGVDFNYSDNTGGGVVYNPGTAHAQSSVGNSSEGTGGVRPLNFGKYIIPQKSLGLYLQDNIQYKFNDVNILNTNIGLRYDNQNGFSSFGPRINSSFKINQKISIRGGLGFMSKSPSLANVFPGNFYFDYLIRDYRTKHYSFNLIQTHVKKIDKINLKPSKSWKYEIGSDISLKWVKMNITGYYNTLYDGFAPEEFFEIYNIPKIDLKFSSDPTKIPSYVISGEKSYIQSYSLSDNKIKNIDKGVELSLSFSKIKSINTSFVLSGNYTHSEIINNSPFIRRSQNPLEKEFIIGYYKRNPERNDYMNFRLTTTHHIPRIRMLLSLTTEFFPLSTKYARVNSIYAYAYRDRELKYHEIPEGEMSNPKYNSLFLNYNATDDIRRGAYFNFHLRMTKEMLSGLSVSLYAINFLNYQPEIRSGRSITYANQKISFGGSIKYIF